MDLHIISDLINDLLCPLQVKPLCRLFCRYCTALRLLQIFCGLLCLWGIIYIYAVCAGLHILYLVILYGGLQGRAKTPPYRAKVKGSVGANSVRPRSFTAAQDFAGSPLHGLKASLV